MKKTILTLAALTSMAAAYAETPQSFEVTSEGVTWSFTTAQTGLMEFASGETLTIQGKSFDLSKVTSMKVSAAQLDDNTVAIAYSAAGASVSVAGNIARYLDVSVTGGYVSIVQSSDLSETEGGEITYILSGTSADGGLALEGKYKATVQLDGLNLTSTTGAPLDIQIGKRINLRLSEGSLNTLTDAPGGKQKGTIVCKGHLEIKGAGKLTVAGKASHAIYAKEYVTIKDAEVTVTEAVKDGLNCAQYFTMKSGTLNISGTGDDGIQCSFKDDADREEEDTGTITVSGGTINASVTATAVKALKADGNFVMTGGSITASTSGGGLWDESKAKTKASACIGTDGYIEISGGTLNLTATGCAGKGMSCDDYLKISDGDITVLTTGGVFAYVNGQEYTDYTGNTDRLDSDAKSSPKGIKSDSDVFISGGRINVTTKGYGGEGIESKGVLSIDGGNIIVRSYDDAINSASHMYIKGGEIEVISTNNDGLDSNGNMYISGGTVRAFGARSPECGIDVNSEEGYSLYFTGGVILGVGGSNSTPSKSDSTQAYVVASTSVQAGQTVTISDGSGTLHTFDIPDDYTASAGGTGPGGFWAPGGQGGFGSGSQVLISLPELKSGSSYTITSGTSTTTATARLTGGSSGPGGRP